MCDPLSAIGLIGSIGGAFMNYSSQESAMENQQRANAEWVAYQTQAANEERAKDEANRQTATAAQQQTLSAISAPNQIAQQQTEQNRLTDTLTPVALQGSPSAITDSLLLSGQKNANPNVTAAMGASVNAAAQQARQRIAALATIQSYGSSQFGLQPTVAAAFQQGNQAIDLASNYRRGDLAAYQVAKNVEPVKYQATPSPFGGIASALGGLAGKGLGNAMVPPTSFGVV
jgi:hypothetical protein